MSSNEGSNHNLDSPSEPTTQAHPIVAIATAPGNAGLAVIRASGRGVFERVQACFKSDRLIQAGSHTVHYAKLIHPVTQQFVDEVMVTKFVAPASFTGEDSVEITCHGGYLVTQSVYEALLAAGLEAAKPGEFTHRSFMNGKMDLSQAEAVAEMIHAKSEQGLRAARQQLTGALGEKVHAFRQALIDTTAMVELELDFSEEDVEFADKERLRTLLKDLDDGCTHLLDTYETGRLIRDGIKTAILGQPNAGKSTLLNALIGQNRAIVSPTAGTTRDTIEADFSIDGVYFRLIDTAGIRQTADDIEAEGVKRSQAAMRDADLILWVKDQSKPLGPEEIALQESMGETKAPVIRVLTHQDLAKEPTLDFANWDLSFDLTTPDASRLGALSDLMIERTLQAEYLNDESTLVTSSRHRQALMEAQAHIQSAIQGLDQSLPGDLIAIDLRGAIQQFGLITGAISNEDVLDSIFSRFCIGK